MKQHDDRGGRIAMLLGGIAGGIIGSRLIPPVFAALTGAWGVRAGGDAFSLLIEDHRRILSILEQMASAKSGSRLDFRTPKHTPAPPLNRKAAPLSARA